MFTRSAAQQLFSNLRLKRWCLGTNFRKFQLSLQVISSWSTWHMWSGVYLILLVLTNLLSASIRLLQGSRIDRLLMKSVDLFVLQMVFWCRIGLFVQEVADTTIWSGSNLGWNSRLQSTIPEHFSHAVWACPCALGLWISYLENPHKFCPRLILVASE